MRQEYSQQDDDALIIDFSQLWNAIQAKKWLILIVTFSFACLATLYSFLLYQDKYQSAGTLLYNSAQASRILTDLDMENPFSKEQSGQSNIYKNQEELLKSRRIAKRVMQALTQQGIKLPVKRVEDFQGKVINASHIKDTDFIKVMASANSPQLAQKIASAYLTSYLDMMNEISYAPLIQQKQLFQKEVAVAEKDLDRINTQIQEYQAQYGILDIAVEGQGEIRQLLALDAEGKNLEASLAQKRAESAKLRRQLKLNRQDITTVLSAVANGQDDLLNSMQEKVQELQKEYASKALIFSETNPDMRQLQEKIDTLKHQIADQQILTAGQTLAGKAGVIKDSVRTDMVGRLVAAETEVTALQHKLGMVHDQYSRQKDGLRDLPEHQLIHAKLQLERKNKEDVLTRLKQKLTEVQIQETAARKKLMVIDQPNQPKNPLFPCRWHIIGLAALAGLILSVVGIAGHTILTTQTVMSEYLEHALGVPILGRLPWLTGEQQQLRSKRKPGLDMMMASTPSVIRRAYQDMALSLKARRNQTGQSILTVASLAQESESSTILSNLAFCLAQSGERVLLIDANLRDPKLHALFQQGLDYEKGLPELINSVSEFLYRSDEIDLADMLAIAEGSILNSSIHPKLAYLNAGLTLDNTFEFLNSKGFSVLIEALKLGYDWILLDAPPFMTQPDAAILLSYTDGLLLLVEKDSESEQLQTVTRQVERLNSSVVGVVLRTSQ